MGHENLYGNVERVFRSGPDSIYLYTNTYIKHKFTIIGSYLYLYGQDGYVPLYFEGGEWASNVGMWQSSPPPFVSQEYRQLLTLILFIIIDQIYFFDLRHYVLHKTNNKILLI